MAAPVEHVGIGISNHHAIPRTSFRKIAESAQEQVCRRLSTPALADVVRTVVNRIEMRFKRSEVHLEVLMNR